jgi:hypothetical protein
MLQSILSMPDLVSIRGLNSSKSAGCGAGLLVPSIGQRYSGFSRYPSTMAAIPTAIGTANEVPLE